MAAAFSDADTEYLIRSVEQRPEIWDTSNENFRNKDLRERAWSEIGADFFQNFVHYGNEEIDVLIAKLQKRWRALRDAFKRYRTKGGYKADAKKQPKFHDLLKFLEKNMDLSSTEYYMEADQTLREVLEQSDVEDEEYHIQIQPKLDSPDKKKTRKVIYEEPAVKNCVAKYDGDRSFLESLLPTLQTFNEEQRLQFRIEVLNALQKCKNITPQAAPISRGPLKSYVLTPDGELKEEKKRPTTAAERMRKMRERRKLEAGKGTPPSASVQSSVKAEAFATPKAGSSDASDLNEQSPETKKIKLEDEVKKERGGKPPVDSVILIWTELLGHKLQEFDILTREILMNETDNSIFKAKVRKMQNCNRVPTGVTTAENTYPMELRYVDMSTMNVTQAQEHQLITASPMSTSAATPRTRVVNKCEIVYVDPPTAM